MPFDSSSFYKEKYDVFSNYFSFVSDTEPPIHYHRWCLLSGIAALLARQVYINHGHFRVYPNLYITLLGEPASRKSTSIKILKRLIRASGYETFAADKTSKEKFLLDLEGYVDPLEDGKDAKDITAENLWGDKASGEPREVFIAADEFSEFTGTGNLEFYTTLGDLWDWDDREKPFTQRLKNSRSVSIFQPTVNILSGTTADLFSKIFPPEIIGSGFLSRLLLIYGERSGRKIAFPRPPDKVLEDSLISFLISVRSNIRGEYQIDEKAKNVLKEIYEGWHEIDDTRFRGYSNRRFTQLLKLCLIVAVIRYSEHITLDNVIEANTILTHAEFLMPKALGEFGKSKNSDVASKILVRLEEALLPLSTLELWSYVSRDLEKKQHLLELLNNLAAADKIQVITHNGKAGYLPKKKVRKTPIYVDWRYLSKEEIELAGIIE